MCGSALFARGRSPSAPRGEAPGARHLQATLKLSFSTAKKVYAHVKRPGLRPSSMSVKQIKAFYETFCKEFPKFTTDMM
eukprot:COSAG01_NODE_380_length_17862_cov_20.427212_21_plen_79_part_00